MKNMGLCLLCGFRCDCKLILGHIRVQIFLRFCPRSYLTMFTFYSKHFVWLDKSWITFVKQILPSSDHKCASNKNCLLPKWARLLIILTKNDIKLVCLHSNLKWLAFFKVKMQTLQDCLNQFYGLCRVSNWS